MEEEDYRGKSERCKEGHSPHCVAGITTYSCCKSIYSTPGPHCLSTASLSSIMPAVECRDEKGEKATSLLVSKEQYFKGAPFTELLEISDTVLLPFTVYVFWLSLCV
jgi:hypothetical protein